MQFSILKTFLLTVFLTNYYGCAMFETLSILVVDDHPMTTDAYINLISSASLGIGFTFQKAADLKTAFKSIEQNFKSGSTFDVALIDISLPPYEEEKILSGTDLAKIIRKRFPDCKIIMLTMHTESLILNRVYKTIHPEGFISKNDIDFATFPSLFGNILKGEIFISKTIKDSLNALLKENVKWDEYDTQIIILLDKGIKTKELPSFIDLSLSSIEKRKANIKRNLLDQKASDDELISVCKVLKLI
ncbi:hypothetical protein FSS13T_14620 [Flavobacterium saliperosum S13]|uniref:DNA-binding response regulator, NarL/FixJ family, contains REC and HTH domains n=3 Tax=Flavobacterium saliperosum TaxID=329186 RepID=A0A1G4VF83_9FLAO|nr:hypothetical protein FSS13T_14620 [Flavobacterium saliperosum S13]SCX05836.1 DNA-binding response regulator, NarL/FixJ family, contains REC and HTH domains [Flavobacterium saliperosum]